MKSDIYVDNNDNEESTINNNEQVENNVKTTEEPEIKNMEPEIKNNEPEIKEKYNNIVPNKQAINKRLNFRDRLLLSRSIAQLR